MSKIEIAVIPAAGLGTRFLPATKAVPKEMLPIIDIPTIQYIATEALESGIKKLIIIVSDNKEAIRKHFHYDKVYEEYLISQGKLDLASALNKIAKEVEVTFVIQKEQKGLGHAIYCVKDEVEGKPFGVLLGDDLVYNGQDKPALKQLIDAYDEVHSSILGVQEVAHKDTSKYGIVAPKDKITSRLFEICNMVEKPKAEDAPSDYAALGRYVLSENIFMAIENTKPGKGDEIQLTDALMLLNKTEKIYAYDFEGIRYDIGDKVGYVKATIDYALRRDDTKDEILTFIKNKAKI